jgi:hypothetical protein
VQSESNGTFLLRDVPPEKFLVSLSGLPDGTYVKDIVWGNQSVLQRGIDLTSEVQGTLKIVLSPKAADVRGLIRNSSNDPIPGATVTIWPKDLVAGAGRGSIKTIHADANGGYRVANLAPGEYRIAAWENIQSGLAQNIDFLSHLESEATAFLLQEGSHESIDARLVSHDKIVSEVARIQ